MRYHGLKCCTEPARQGGQGWGFQWTNIRLVETEAEVLPSALGQRTPVVVSVRREGLRLSIMGDSGVTCLIVHKTKGFLELVFISYASWWFWKQSPVPVGLL